MKFSKNTFIGFTRKKQGKKLTEFIAEIDSNWENKTFRIELLNEFQMYLKLMQYHVNEDITQLSQREFLTLVVPIEQKFDINKKDNEFIILKQDEIPANNKKIPLYLILADLRSAFNVGSIFRTAECFGVSHIYLCGYTPTPQNKKVQKTAMGTEKYVNWSEYSQVSEVIKKLKNDGFTIYALETTTNAKNISKIKFNRKCALIMGNEALGISQNTLKQADEIVQVPLVGWKNSLNVGICAAISCYEVSRQWYTEEL